MRDDQEFWKVDQGSSLKPPGFRPFVFLIHHWLDYRIKREMCPMVEARWSYQDKARSLAALGLVALRSVSPSSRSTM
jgi:hypothetical protein